MGILREQNCFNFLHLSISNEASGVDIFMAWLASSSIAQTRLISSASKIRFFGAPRSYVQTLASGKFVGPSNPPGIEAAVYFCLVCWARNSKCYSANYISFFLLLRVFCEEAPLLSSQLRISDIIFVVVCDVCLGGSGGGGGGGSGVGQGESGGELFFFAWRWEILEWEKSVVGLG